MWLACGLLSTMLMATGCRTHTPNWWTYKYLRSQLFLFSNNVGFSSGRIWPSFLLSVPTVAGTALACSKLNITEGNQVSVERPLGKDVSDPGRSHWPTSFPILDVYESQDLHSVPRLLAFDPLILVFPLVSLRLWCLLVSPRYIWSWPYC